MPVNRPPNHRAAQLRRNQTDVERRLWFALRDRRLANAKFRRQVPIGPYIVDFLCSEAHLIIELDGGQHGGPQDLIRQQWLEAQGYVVKRFWNNEVTFDLPTILACIAALTQSPPA